MSTNRYLGVNASATRPDVQPRKFTSQWAIPRVEPVENLKSPKKKRQLNNLALLFIVFVFKQIKKLFSSGGK